jgi:hypothetical protein
MYKLISKISRFSMTVAVSAAILIIGATVAVAVAMGPPHFAQKINVSEPIGGDGNGMANNPVDRGSQVSTGQGGGGDMKGQNVTGQSVTSSVVASSNQGKLSVKVNGQDIDLHGAQHVKKVISSPDGQTNIEVNVSGDGQGATSNSSSATLNLHVDSSSTSTGG